MQHLSRQIPIYFTC